MKYINNLLVCIIAILLNLIGIVGAHAEQADASKTNVSGLYASVKDWKNAPGGGHEISVTIHFTNPFTNPGVTWRLTILTNANGGRLIQDPSKSWKYFRATNSFCGFVELRDSAGQKLGLIKPEVNRQDSYPATYNLQVARQVLMHNRVFLEDGSRLPYPLLGSNPAFSFYLKDYFSIKKSDEYQLTVWPKIYKRSATNDDLCERIDLLPVTIPIKWNGYPTN